MSSVSAPSDKFDEFEEDKEEGPHLPFFLLHKNKSDILQKEKLALSQIIYKMKPQPKND